MDCVNKQHDISGRYLIVLVPCDFFQKSVLSNFDFLSGLLLISIRTILDGPDFMGPFTKVSSKHFWFCSIGPLVIDVAYQVNLWQTWFHEVFFKASYSTGLNKYYISWTYSIYPISFNFFSKVRLKYLEAKQRMLLVEALSNG